ncbi:M4 family metallopeptidase [Aquimarina intermedia]|uniref:Putative secreted protein (Por secretion system target) n=1 Tax=Aquimarina intermedia TaxID=350814 RepID=A0A5S5C4D1_9FLAO|nr:M4 family metallopeptidase [Aquimarina intermedia]TYP72813.1 putative secreted protein (Por secretion system target) [Aquimarina intermedia]
MITSLPKRIIFGVTLCFQGLFLSNAQISQDISANLSKDVRVSDFIMEPNRGTPSLIKMKNSGTTLSLPEVPEFFRSALGVGQETQFVNEATTVVNGIQIDKFQQYTNGIKVEHGVFKAMSKNSTVLGFSAEYYALPSTLTSTPALNESVALQKALDHVGATTYAWDYLKTLGNSEEITAAYNELYPQGELVFVDNYLTSVVDLTLAYKFNIYAAEPLSRADIYVDAASGQVLLLDAIIKHVDANHTKEDIAKEIKTTAAVVYGPQPYAAATGDTRYAGRRNFDTSQDENGNWVLKGMTPSGVENETLSYEGFGGLPINAPISGFAVPVVDGDGDVLNPEMSDNNWTASEHRKDDFSLVYGPAIPVNGVPSIGHNEAHNDDVALDAHWGAEVVLDYWKNVHDRSSYDNLGSKITNYVHYGDAYDNAFWNGTAMTYGDGSYQGGQYPNGSFAPLTSMDVCAHEIGHGVCEFTADLVYQRESGAMNEGFSDIWGASVEAYVLAQIDNSLEYDPWGIGEQIDERDGGIGPGTENSRALRWMDDPKASGDPDAYGGDNWIDPECGTPTLANDQCGVHTNSGVLNKWYYLLVSGSGNSFSPGFNKQTSDDAVTDKGNSYMVNGIGFLKAAKIAYMGETMLSPNAKFIEMREASILAAQLLYGPGSNEEVQTTNAWYAVDIGESYSTGDPNTINFNTSNVTILSENNLINGCDDINTYAVYFNGVEVDPSATITISTAGSTATKGIDFDLSTASMTFAGTSVESLNLIVYDDAQVEDTETIVLSFNYNGEFFSQEFFISDDDFTPRTGNTAFSLLEENFSNGYIPVGWSVISLSDGNNVWRVDGMASAEGRAYISDGISELPVYDTNSTSNIVLKSTMINAGAAADVTVSFDWEAGGETDAIEGTIFDYGEFMYSLDGSNFITMQQFYGSGPVGVITEQGQYAAVINELDGKSFMLAWRWFNDTNAGTAFSFAIDNVKITAIPAGIETEKNETATTKVHVGTTTYFLSNSDKALIGKIENASEDLGCVTLSVIDQGTSFEIFSNINTARPSKAYSISTENQNASYDLTLYFTTEEMKAFDQNTVMIPMKVNSNVIDDAIEDPNNMQYNGALTAVNNEDGFKAYTGSFTGSGALSIVREFDYAPVEAADPTPPTDPTSPTEEEEEECRCDKHNKKHKCDDKYEDRYVKGNKGGYHHFTMYPNPAITVVNLTTDAQVKKIAVYNLYGVLVSTAIYATPTNYLELNTNGFDTGLYVVKITTNEGEVFDTRFVKI